MIIFLLQIRKNQVIGMLNILIHNGFILLNLKIITRLMILNFSPIKPSETEQLKPFSSDESDHLNRFILYVKFSLRKILTCFLGYVCNH